MSTDSNLPPSHLTRRSLKLQKPRRWRRGALSGRLIDMPIEEELKGSYLTYAMSVIVSRAMPDVRDGLKPSQRRILVAMNDLNLTPGAGRVKCAKISGDTSGNYHPHGESVIYPTLVRMAQEWNMRHVLVDKQGNFGSIAGLPPAAMRYTEARMSPIAALLMEDLKLDTVDFVPTYDERRTEPTVLPSKFPNLLVNGANGIAVGMATSIPPHNLGEICDAIIRVIDDPDVSIDELLEIVPGPDFPTGGVVCGRAGIRRGYYTGRSTIVVRARAAHRGTRQPQSHRGDRDSLPAVARPHRGTDRGAGERGKNRRHFQHPQRERPEGARAADLRVEARRRSRDRAESALPVLAAARQFLADLPGPGRRQAAGAFDQGVVAGVPAPSRDGHPPADAIPAQPGPPAETHRRRAAVGPRQHRRSDPRDPHLVDAGRGQRTLDADRNAGGPVAAGAGRRRIRHLRRRTRPEASSTRSRPSRPTPSCG